MTTQTLDLKQAVLDGIYLFSNSKDHRHYSISEFLSYLVYPVLHNKIQFFYDEGMPVGLVTWCYLSNEKAQRFLDDEYILQEEDYVAEDGDQLWGIEFIALYGHTFKIMRRMKEVHRDRYGSTRTVYWRRFKARRQIHKGVFSWAVAAEQQSIKD
jgi:hemolysin-activating ACP:hemolysin acyltransferase